jgi:hypothetical protein
VSRIYERYGTLPCAPLPDSRAWISKGCAACRAARYFEKTQPILPIRVRKTVSLESGSWRTDRKCCTRRQSCSNPNPFRPRVDCDYRAETDGADARRQAHGHRRLSAERHIAKIYPTIFVRTPYNFISGTFGSARLATCPGSATTRWASTSGSRRTRGRLAELSR